jgi:hypothetical protein
MPIRARLEANSPFTIAITPLFTEEPRWHALSDVLGSVLLEGPAPKILRALRFEPKGRERTVTVHFRGDVPISTAEPLFKTLVEQRQIAKHHSRGNRELGRLEMGLKTMVNSAYGITAEVNITPHDSKKILPGMVYSDIIFESPDVHDERPGAFSNPIIASVVTGGARLVLAMLEAEVAKRGANFILCDTDSLGIALRGTSSGSIVPGLQEHDIEEIVTRFDALNPYDPNIVPHFLKVEYSDAPDLHCFAVSAKRYVLFRWRADRCIEIVKASESGLGAILGRTPGETTSKLARRIWLAILIRELKVSPKQRRRAKPLVAFDIPMRRKFPISQPSILKRLIGYNRSRSYDFQVKPFGFVQSVTPAIIGTKADPLPIAPFEKDFQKSRRLPWIDFHTGKAVELDWDGSHLAGTLPVMRLSEYIEQYRRHPEAKAADRDGNPSGPDTVGLLGRLTVRSERLARIGKEVDRLDQDEGASLEPRQPIEYDRESLAEDIAYLATFPQEPTARELGLTVRGWRNLIKGRSKPRDGTTRRIRQVSAGYRSVG